MNSTTFSQLTDEELTQKLKSIKNHKIIDATLIGFSVGVAFFGAINKGFGVGFILPLIMVYIFFKNSKNNKILEKEAEEELKRRAL